MGAEVSVPAQLCICFYSKTAKEHSNLLAQLNIVSGEGEGFVDGSTDPRIVMEELRGALPALASEPLSHIMVQNITCGMSFTYHKRLDMQQIQTDLKQFSINMKGAEIPLEYRSTPGGFDAVNFRKFLEDLHEVASMFNCILAISVACDDADEYNQVLADFTDYPDVKAAECNIKKEDL